MEKKLSFTSSGTRGTQRNVKLGLEGLPRIKEEDIPVEIFTGESINRRVPERFPSPISSQSSMHWIPQAFEVENSIKVEVKEEAVETYVMSDGRYKEEEIPLEISTGLQEEEDPVEQEKTPTRIPRRRVDTAIEIGELVDQVHGFPEIWDITSSAHSNNVIKARAWESIGRHFYPRYDDYSATTQDKIQKLLKKKWKSVRDRYNKDAKHRRDCRNGQAPSKYRYHSLFQELSFLQKTFESKISNSNVREVASEEEPNVEDVTQDSSVASGHSATDTRDSDDESPSIPSVQAHSHMPRFQSEGPRSPVLRPPRRNRTKSQQEIAEFKTEVLTMIKDVSSCVEKSMEPKDSLSAFFISLEKDAREFTGEDLDEMKIELLKTVAHFKKRKRLQAAARASWPGQGQHEPGPSHYNIPPMYPTTTHSCTQRHPPSQGNWYSYGPPRTPSNYPYAHSEAMYGEPQPHTCARDPEHTTGEAIGTSVNLVSRSSTPNIL
ncbi:uncharacterized protein [Hyperolius riggenbachi]|uniref:uncharacterized protein isoform X2 n=1 Tax=Hyperolius riggenbachi TaxID=752182 RepID=UPI0035A35E5D